MSRANPGQITIVYKEIADGGELIFSTLDTSLISALHVWFDSQLSDHGKDAASVHSHEDMKK